jgi:antitoxin component YwqK of YwqJK toxin-antitoxin module
MMKKVFVLCALTSALAGCGKSEYSFEEVSNYTGNVGTPYGVYLERKSGERLNGTVVHKVGDQVLQSFKVTDGVVVGEWRELDQNGKLLVEGQLKNGAFVGPKKTWCKGEFASHLENVTTVYGDRHAEQRYDCASGLQTSDSTVIPGKDFRTANIRVGAQREWAVINGEQKLTLLETFASDGSGKLEGAVERYDYKGVLKERATYKNGQLDGVRETWWTMTDGSSRPASKESYNAGKKNGESEHYFSGGHWPVGTVEEKGSYAHDQQTGRWVRFTPGDVMVRDIDNPPDTSPMAMRLWDAAQGQIRSADWTNEVKDLDAFAYLVKGSHIDVNRRLHYEDSPLITVAADNVYDYLVSIGADPMGRDIKGNTRLMKCLDASSYTRCSVEHMVTLAGKEDLKAHNVYGDTALSLFCQKVDDLQRRRGAGQQSEALFKALLKGSEVNTVAYAGETPLHACMAQRNHTYAQALVAAGANLEARDIDGTTPLAAAFYESYDAAGTSHSITWSADRIKFVASFQGQSGFTFDSPVPLFGKSIRQIVLENGDTASAMLIDSLVGTAKG